MAKILCIAGPTASGKSALSVALAKHFGGEVVSCDSMQIYKHMDIGTAKITPSEMQGIPHYMLDIAEPTQSFSVADYVENASDCVDKLIARNILPIVAGGTGLYMDSLISGINFNDSPVDLKIRERLTQQAEQEGGIDELFAKLAEVDPEIAATLHINNKKRIIRALEFFETTGKTISEHNRETQLRPKRYDAVYIGLTTSDRAILYDRINRRIDKMIADGLSDEVETLYRNNRLGDTASQAIGYKEFVGFFNGEYSFEHAVDILKQRSRNYAKRQLTWFKRNPNIFWLDYDCPDDFEKIFQKAVEFVKNNGIM